MKNRFFAKSENVVLRGLFLTSILLIFSAIVYAAVTLVGFTGIAANTFYPGELNRVVYQFNITDNGTGDTLSSIEATNAGTADEPGDISSVKLWYQAAGGVFNELSAQYVATLQRTSARTWAGVSLNHAVVTASSFYVTVDISSAPANNSTTKFSIAKNMISFTAGGKFPNSTRTNASAQTILNIDKLYVYYENTAETAIVKGQSDAPLMNVKFRNSSASANVIINSLSFTSVNYAGETAADTVFAGIRVKDSSDIQTGYSAAGGTPQTVIALSPPFTVPAGGAEVLLKISADIAAAANTYDAGLKIAAAVDIVTAGSNTTEAYSGYVFPMESGRSEIKDAADSVNVSFESLAPGSAAKGQQGIDMMRITLTHPNSVTTYSSARVNGLTVTASSNPALGLNQYLTALILNLGAEEYGRISLLPAGNEAAIALNRELVLNPGGSAVLELAADSTAGSSCDSFLLSITGPGKINCTDNVSGGAAAVSGVFPFSSSQVMLQQPVTGVSVLHTNKMPQYAARGQGLVYCEDLVFTHLNSGNYSAALAAGVTLTVENEIGGGVVPSEVVSRVLITDASGNTLSDYLSIPSAGSRVYIDFTNPLVIPAGASRTAKIFISLTAAPSESYVKLNINSSSAVRCLDANSNQSIAVQAASGDAFPMKTSAVQIVDPATEVHGYRFDTLQPSVNRGQGNAYLTGMYFINPALGIAAVNSVTIGIFDAAGASLNSADYISSVVVERASNTAVVYAIVPVVTGAAYVSVPFSQPLVMNPGAANAVSVNVRAIIKYDAPLNNFKAGMHQDFASAVDYTSGLPINVFKKPDAALFESGLCTVEDRAQTLNVFYDGANAGTASKGDASTAFMKIGFSNPAGAGTSAVLVRGITLTAEEGIFPGPSTAAINASSVFSKVYADNGSNTAEVFGEKAAPFSGSTVYIPFNVPFSVAAGSSVTVNVRADISTSAPVGFYRLNLQSAYGVSGVDANERLGVTVTAAPGYVFPDMVSDFINVLSSDKLTVAHTDISPAKASTSQKNTPLILFDFGNASDAPVAVKGLTLNVRADGLDAAASALFENIYAVDAGGNTLLALNTSALDQTGSSPLAFTLPLEIPASQTGRISVYADIKMSALNVSYEIRLLSQAEVDALPLTLNVQAAAGRVFPMGTAGTLVQNAALAGGVHHTDVIPTTVSTGQTDIFAEILSISNINPTGSAAITLAGITFTIEDDTNNVINPALALKRVLIRDDSKIYAFMTAVPSAAAPFFVEFSEPLTLETAQASDLKIYVDIADTLSSGTFQAFISVSGDIRLLDANSGTTISAQAINGDSFPMKTSNVIIQEKAYACLVSYENISPLSVNRGQTQVPLLKAVLENQGGASGANEIVTRINIFTEDLSGTALTPKDALSAVYVKDASGALYGSVSLIPDYGDMISIGLTTPVTLRPGQPAEVYLYGSISAAAPAAGFKALLKTGSNLTVRDANSYEIILAEAKTGYSFPMKTGGISIQNSSDAVQIAHASLLSATVNKGEMNTEAILFEIFNPNPAGFSAVNFTGITLTVENGLGSALVPSTVLSGLKISADNGPSYLAAEAIPSFGSTVYLPVVPAAPVPAGASIKVTVYADIAPVTAELYMRLGLKLAADTSFNDANDGGIITQVNPYSGHSFPMNSLTATINSAPGIQAAQIAQSQPYVTAGQEALGCAYRFHNIGSFSEDVSGLTITAANAGSYIESISVLDDGGNTVMSRAVGAAEGPELYLGLEAQPLVVQPQDYNELYIFVSYREVTYQAEVVYSLEESGIKTDQPVSAALGFSFPLLSSLTLQAQSTGLTAGFTDLMPPAVSTGQADIYAAALDISNPEPAGYSGVYLNSITVEIRDDAGNTIPSSAAVANMSIYGLSGLYGEAASSGSHLVTVILNQPLLFNPGESDAVYVVFDAAAYSTFTASSFSVSLSAGSFETIDANSGNTLSVSAAAGGPYPFVTAAALIQKAANALKITAYGIMPSVISTGQKNVNALRLILEGDGSTSTASVMVTRINLYTLNSSAVQSASSSCVSKAGISGSNGAVAGEAVSSSASKITLNLTSPVIVPAGQHVTVYARFDALSSIDIASFMLSVESQADIYAVDANSFKPVTNINAAFPMRPAAVTYQNAADFVSVSFNTLLQPAVTRGAAGIEVSRLVISNPAAAGSAALELTGITLNAYGALGQPLQAVSAISALTVENESGLVLANAVPGFSDLIYLQFVSPLAVNPGNAITLLFKTDISGAATAEGFSLSAVSGESIGIYDVNSGTKPQFTGGLFPCSSATAYIYDAPAQELYVWHDGTSFAPGQAGRGQKNIKFMSLSMLNPGSAGTSSAYAKGVTIYVVDGTGNTLAPAEIFDFIKISDLTGTYYYGGATASAAATAGPLYAQFEPPYAAPASNTVTVYFSGDISASASITSFRLVIESGSDISAYDVINGDIPVYPYPVTGSFPMTTTLTSVIATTNILTVSHTPLMPVSAEKGRQRLEALGLQFESETQFDIAVEGITITVKGRSGEQISADSVITAAYITDVSGNTVYGSAAAGSAAGVYVPISGLGVPSYRSAELRVSLDISEAASDPFMVEFEGSESLKTGIAVLLQAAAGDYFGNMKSGSVSIQEADFEKSFRVYPSPFNPDAGKAVISYYLKEDSIVTIRIFTPEGREVMTVCENKNKTAGMQSSDEWDGKNSSSSRVKSGVYVCVIEAAAAAGGGKTIIKKTIGVLR